MIKRYSFIVAILLCVSTASAFSTELCDSLKRVEEKKVCVKLNGLVVIGIVNPAIEVKVWDYLSVQLDFMGVFAPKNFLWTGYPLSLGTGFVELRYYPKKTFRGFFCAANVGYGIFRMNKNIYPKFIFGYETNPNTIFVGQALFAGITIGWSFNLPNNWGIEVFWGGGYERSEYESYTHSDDGSIRYREWNASAEWLPGYRGGSGGSIWVLIKICLT